MNYSNTLFSFGAFLFAMCMAFCYRFKSKQAKYRNIIFAYVIRLLIVTIVTEIAAVYFLSTKGTDNIFTIIASRANNISTILWVLGICWYLITLGKAFDTSLLNYLKKYKTIKFFTLFFTIVIIVTLFFPFESVVNEKGAYLNGPPQNILYISGGIALFLSAIVVYRNKSYISKFNRLSLVICAIVSAAAMIYQKYDPYILVITASFVCDVYVLYFLFENPDLFLISELNAAEDLFNESNSVRTDFLSNMNHEIRTPINAIIGFSEGIFNSPHIEWDQIKSDVNHIESASKNLLEIINNILDVSRIESDWNKLEVIDYNTEDIFLETKDLALNKIISNDVKFELHISENIPKKLNGDYDKLSRILLNLLNNSVRYTEVGKIMLNADCNIIGNTCELIIKLSDTGIGFDDDTKNKVYLYLNNISNTISGSNGLGIIIVKTLCDILGAQLSFDSEYGAGSSFTIKLKQNIVDKTPIGNINNKSLVKEKVYLNCSGLNIMVVDDNQLNLKVAEKVLNPYNCNTITFGSGRECIDTIKKGIKFDLILLDYMMPEMDGIEVLHILKRLEGFNVPPIVVLTANAITGMKEVYLKEGFDDYLAKPIDANELDRVINKFLRDTVNNSEIENKIIVKENISHNNNANSIKILQDYGVDYLSSLSYISDIDSYNDILKDFYKSLDKTINDLTIARNNRDLLSYSTVTHSLKSNCQSLGFKDFAEIAFKHEQAGNANDLSFIDSHFNDIVRESDKVKKIIEKYLNIH